MAPGPTTGVGVQDVHPTPEKPVAVNPAGSESVTVTVPLVGALPTLLTVSVYCLPTSPWCKVPVWLFCTVTSETVKQKLTWPSPDWAPLWAKRLFPESVGSTSEPPTLTEEPPPPPPPSPSAVRPPLPPFPTVPAAPPVPAPPLIPLSAVVVALPGVPPTP